MHILIDVQGYQSESKYRGIGRGTLSISRAIIKNAGEHRVSILINGMYSIDNINDIKKSYQDILPEHDMFIFSAVAPTAYHNVANHDRIKAAKALRDIAIANIHPDLVFVTSFFEGESDNYITSIPDKPTPWKTVCIAYDFIPLMNKEQYLGDPNYCKFYMDKLIEYERADAVFAISKSVVQEVIDHTSISTDQIFNISFAVNQDFRVQTYSTEEIQLLKNKYNLPDEFIFTLAMIEPRKNIERLIHAYSILPGKLQQRYPLVLAYNVNANDLERILCLAESYGLARNQLIFTGYLTDYDLIALYNLCKLFVFPSLHEGFGLPPLEAMCCGAATLCSNTTSLPEIMGWNDAMFDPENIQDISQLIEKALLDETFFNSLKKHAIIQSKNFSWDQVARLVLDGFENLQKTSTIKSSITNQKIIETRIAEIKKIDVLNEIDTIGVAWAIARNSFKKHTRKLLLDISVLVHHDAKTGIQRVSRSLLGELLKMEVKGYYISAVYYSPGEGYRYANEYQTLHFGNNWGFDELVLFSKGDILLVTDLTAHLFPEIVCSIDNLRIAGAKACFLVYDIIAIKNPQWCDEGINSIFTTWLSCLVKHADLLICISATVKNDVSHWIAENAHTVRASPLLKISHFHLGADFQTNISSIGRPSNADEIIEKIRTIPSFIIVGTIEPRKMHAQVLTAFEGLWRSGKHYNLVLVGKKGWKSDQLCEKICSHPEINQKLFWLQNISDEFLSELYTASLAMIFASANEGFGLPLIEAAQKKLPIIARDIPIFKEIAQDNAFYFSGKSPVDLQNAIEEWLILYNENAHPRSEKINWLTWRQSTEWLLKCLPLIND